MQSDPLNLVVSNLLPYSLFEYRAIKCSSLGCNSIIHRLQLLYPDSKHLDCCFIYLETVVDSDIRHLKIRRRRRQRQRGRQKSNRFNIQNKNFARASRFFVHFFAVTARLRRDNALFHVSHRKYACDDEISSLILNLEMTLRNSALGGFTYI